MAGRLDLGVRGPLNHTSALSICSSQLLAHLPVLTDLCVTLQLTCPSLLSVGCRGQSDIGCAPLGAAAGAFSLIYLQNFPKHPKLCQGKISSSEIAAAAPRDFADLCISAIEQPLAVVGLLTGCGYLEIPIRESVE